MISFLSALLVSSLLLSTPQASAISSKSYSASNGKTKHTIHYVSFDRNEGLFLTPVIANGKVGTARQLKAIADDVKAVAAVNGTYFNAYDPKDLQPFGTLMSYGKLQHHKGNPVLVGITKSNDLLFAETSELKIEGVVGEGLTWKDRWYAWSLNHSPTASGEIGIFDDAYKTDQLAFKNFTFVTVSSDGVILAKRKESATIPKGGYVIAIDTVPANQRYIDRFVVNETVSYNLTFPESFKGQDVVALVSSGPRLLRNGVVDLDLDRYADPKIKTARSQRSFFGSTTNGAIVIGTVSNATSSELATVTRQIGLSNAVALDGGASSGLYYQGKYLTTPSRALSNALVIKKK